MSSAIVSRALMALLVLSGCGPEDQQSAHSTGGEQVEVTTKGRDQLAEMKITTREGTATVTVGSRAASEELGIPPYPGAAATDGGAFSISETTGAREPSLAVTAQFTRDPIDRVAAFYRTELQGRSPEVFEMNTPQGRMVNFLLEEQGTTTAVVLLEDTERGGTNIQISKTVD